MTNLQHHNQNNCSLDLNPDLVVERPVLTANLLTTKIIWSYLVTGVDMTSCDFTAGGKRDFSIDLHTVPTTSKRKYSWTRLICVSMSMRSSYGESSAPSSSTNIPWDIPQTVHPLISFQDTVLMPSSSFISLSKGTTFSTSLFVTNAHHLIYRFLPGITTQ